MPPGAVDPSLEEDGARLAAALDAARDRSTSAALLVVSVVGLYAVRGLDGRSAASRAAEEIQQRLAVLRTEGSVVVPLDRGNVAIVCPGTDQPAAVALAERVVALVGEPIAMERPARLMANVGVAVAASTTGRSHDVVRDADLALAAAIGRGPGSVEAFRPGLRQEIQTRMHTAVDLAAALADGDQLFLHYQPVVDLTSDAVVGAEALVRWHRPDVGLVPPDDFVPVAEQTGLISELGAWVLETAVRQLVVWEPLVGPDFRLHVNLSPVQARQPGLAQQVCDLLDRYGVAPARLLLEITETGLVGDGPSPVMQLARLREAGVGICIDDFGTGYSSISRLRELPVDMVKVDRSLTALVASTPDEFALTRAIFGLVRSSGLHVVAEGIEQHAQLAHLRAMRCRFGQGFLLARPGEADLMTTQLRGLDG